MEKSNENKSTEKVIKIPEEKSAEPTLEQKVNTVFNTMFTQIVPAINNHANKLNQFTEQIGMANEKMDMLKEKVDLLKEKLDIEIQKLNL